MVFLRVERRRGASLVGTDECNRRLVGEEGQPAEHGASDGEAGGIGGRAMQYSSRPGENVLDLFGGSGSTLIGAEQAGRKAFLMELDPPYCDVIVTRWENFTGKKAERVPRGDCVAI
jgi:hypothetical protein